MGESVPAGYVVSGGLMVVVGCVAAVLWRAHTGARWRWFWIGACLWTAAVAVKVAWALLANEAVLGLAERLPSFWRVALGTAYVGGQSAVCEMGFTLGAALLWGSMAARSRRAAGVGVGAGAVEAVLLGAVALAAWAFARSAHPEAAQARDAMRQAAAAQPLFWLVGPVERVSAILAHVGTRVCVLAGVARRRAAPVVVGFCLFAVLDGIAGFVHIMGLVGKSNMWWTELALAVVAAAAALAGGHYARNWPAPPQAPPDGGGAADA